MLTYLQAGVVIGLLFTFCHAPSQLRCYSSIKARGFWSGISVALGSVVVQFLYGWLALSFLFAQGNVSGHLNKLFVIIAGIVLLYMAYQELGSRFVSEEFALDLKLVEGDVSNNLWMNFNRSMASSFQYARRIVGYLVVFLAIGITFRTGVVKSVFDLLIGIVIGELVWWILFTSSLVFSKASLKDKFIKICIRIGGVFFVLLAALAFYQGFGAGFHLIA